MVGLFKFAAPRREQGRPFVRWFWFLLLHSEIFLFKFLLPTLFACVQNAKGKGNRNDFFDVGEPFDAFRRFGSFGSHRTMMPSLFGGGDPFDYPLFTRPFGSMFESSIFDQSATRRETPVSNGGKGIVIEELTSDDEEDRGKDEGTTESAGSGKEPSIEHPDEGANDGKIQNMNHRIDYDKVQRTKSQAHGINFQTCRVTYGGIGGAYYISTKNRTTSSDGTVIEERKEADRTTGQATHRISSGIHDKGHSVTRKLNSDGKVDTTQTLHNLNEDELAEFEEAWKSKASESDAHAGTRTDEQMRKALWDGWRLPSREQARYTGGQGSDTGTRTNSGGRIKKIVRINIE